jgi:hypothetical protein
MSRSCTLRDVKLPAYLVLLLTKLSTVRHVIVQGAGEHGRGGRLPELRHEAYGLGDDAHEAGRWGVQVCTGQQIYLSFFLLYFFTIYEYLHLLALCMVTTLFSKVADFWLTGSGFCF